LSIAIQEVHSPKLRGFSRPILNGQKNWQGICPFIDLKQETALLTITPLSNKVSAVLALIGSNVVKV
jgi:hypothetical protein